MRTFIGGLVWSTIVVAYPLTPVPHQTPGDICSPSDVHFEEYRYPEQIAYCRRQVSTSLKSYIYKQYKISASYQDNYTIDHMIPLSIGGSNQIQNLWPEHYKVKALRPHLEYKVYLSLRDAEITQVEAINIIRYAKFNPGRLVFYSLNDMVSKLRLHWIGDFSDL